MRESDCSSNVIAGVLAASRTHCAHVHFITNYVTVNDCANMTLAAGGSPVMTAEPLEAAEMTLLCDALVINTGTPSERSVEAMMLAGKAASKAGHPVVLDPVGAGATAFRNRIMSSLLESVRFSIIKGNASEIKFLASGTGAAQGVDVAPEDALNASNRNEYARLASQLSQATGACIVISGPDDIVASGTKVWLVHNGDRMMATVSGTGCMSAAVLASFAGASPHRDAGETALAAMCAMGAGGELARERLDAAQEGSATYRTRLIDAVSLMSEETLLSRARITSLSFSD